MIDSFRGKYGFLSNFYLAQVKIDGYYYPSSEHAFQAQKAVKFEDHEAIRLASSPKDAKALGRKVEARGDWGVIRIDIMKKCLEAKFDQNKFLKQSLLSTGEEELIEGNTWHDIFWGRCDCLEHQGKGMNVLGRLLMELREKLK